MLSGMNTLTPALVPTHPCLHTFFYSTHDPWHLMSTQIRVEVLMWSIGSGTGPAGLALARPIFISNYPLISS